MVVKTVWNEEPALFDVQDTEKDVRESFVRAFGVRPNRVAVAVFPYIDDEDGEGE